MLWMQVHYQMYDSQILSPGPCFVFLCSWRSLLKCGSFNCGEVQLNKFFSFIDPAVWGWSVMRHFTVILRTLSNSRSWRFSPMFSSKSFIVLVLTFRSTIHFGLTLGYGVRSMSELISLKRLSFLHWCLRIFVGNQFTVNVKIHSLTFSCAPLICMFISVPIPHCPIYCVCLVSFEVLQRKSFNFVFFRMVWLF